MKRLLILGAGAHGKNVKEICELRETYTEIDFLDDQCEEAVGCLEDYKDFCDKYQDIFVAFGDSKIRQHWMKRLVEDGCTIPCIIHPQAIVSPSANLGKGCYIGGGAVVSANTVIEEGCIVGIGALIDHDATVKSYAYVRAGEVVKERGIYV